MLYVTISDIYPLVSVAHTIYSRLLPRLPIYVQLLYSYFIVLAPPSVTADSGQIDVCHLGTRLNSYSLET